MPNTKPGQTINAPDLIAAAAQAQQGTFIAVEGQRAFYATIERGVISSLKPLASTSQDGQWRLTKVNEEQIPLTATGRGAGG